MATIVLKCSSSNSSLFNKNGRLKVTYTASSDGTIEITQLAGCRTDGHHSYNLYKKSVSVKISNTKKTVSLSHGIDFTANSNYTGWGATDTTWTGMYYTSVKITITMPDTSQEFGGAIFTGTISIPLTEYTVSYNANGGSGAPSSQTKYYGKTLTLRSTKPTRSGYTFAGWGVSTTDTSVNYAAGGKYTKNASDTLYAIWKKTIKLTYNANGGKGAPSAQSATIYNATTSKTFSIKSTKPTRTGYNFKGWSKSSTATSATYVYGDTITLTTSDTLYAVWEKKTYTISYRGNGGTLPTSSSFINPQTKTYGVALKLNTLKPTRAALIEDDTRTTYTFRGWSTSSSATTATYLAGSKYTANASARLYAVWTPSTELITYSIIYDSCGGSSVSTQIKKPGVNIKLHTTPPTKDGYTFEKWNTEEDNTGTSYLLGATYTKDEDILLYAIWTPWEHTVQFNANGGSGSVPSSFTKVAGVDKNISETVPTRSGYLFKEWNTKSNGSGTSYTPGQEYTKDINGGTVTLYAIWVSTDILIYTNGSCKALHFKEGSDILIFNKNGEVECNEFIEGSVLKINSTAFYITELKEGE